MNCHPDAAFSFLIGCGIILSLGMQDRRISAFPLGGNARYLWMETLVPYYGNARFLIWETAVS